MVSRTGRSTIIARRALWLRSSRKQCSSSASSTVLGVLATPTRSKKSRMEAGVYPRRRRPDRVGIRGIVPTVHHALLHQAAQLALRHKGIAEVEPGEFNLPGGAASSPELSRTQLYKGR